MPKKKKTEDEFEDEDELDLEEDDEEEEEEVKPKKKLKKKKAEGWGVVQQPEFFGFKNADTDEVISQAEWQVKVLNLLEEIVRSVR